MNRIIYINCGHSYKITHDKFSDEKKRNTFFCDTINKHLELKCVVCLQGVSGDLMRKLKEKFQGLKMYYYNLDKTPVLPIGAIIPFDNLLKYPDEFMCIICPKEIIPKTNYWIKSPTVGCASAVCSIDDITIINSIMPATVDDALKDIKYLQDNFKGNKIIISDFNKDFKYDNLNVICGCMISPEIYSGIIFGDLILEETPYPARIIIFDKDD